jgi:predicted dinucleotide-binding enzyme
MNKLENNIAANYAIIGFGKIGKALAKAFARKGIDVAVATTRQPEVFSAEAAAIGKEIIPSTLADAVKAEVIFLAVRFESHPDVAKVLADWQGKIIVDVTNAYGVPPEKLGGLPSAQSCCAGF